MIHKSTLESSEAIPVYDSMQRGSLAWEELRQVYQYRDWMRELIRRNIVARYKRSVLGVAWSMLNPLGMMIVLTLVFSQLFGDIAGYPAYLLSGLIVWNFFSLSTTTAIEQLVWGGYLFQNIFAPKATFAISAVGTGIVNLLISLVPLIVVILMVGLSLSPAVVFLPISILLIACFTLGVGLFISAIAIFFPDVADVYQIFMVAWMYLTPIFYPIEIVPDEIRRLIILFNPMYHLLQLFRIPIYEGRFPTWFEFWPSLVISMGVLVIGWFVFTRKSDEFAYRV